MVGIIAGLFIALITYRINTKRKLKQTNLLKQVSDAELKAIRSQLNPHFLFNALSAIQNLVNQNKNDLANDYIVKLSKLLRRVLNQSDESLHSLQEELELAELYLELERLRIPFEYQIQLDGGIDRNTLVPSMILQPYLENAVFHGVSKYKANQINVALNQQGVQLICTIKDNAQHDGNFFTEGKGMSMGRDRIDILRKQVGMEIKADINTSKSTDGFKVEINLPLNL
jgi:LytS/YehU family sensor histidine kinase